MTLKAFVPGGDFALLAKSESSDTGSVALLSLEVSPTVSVTLVTRFQSASTARTVTLKELPAVSAVGVPILPVAVPGAAVSPGANSCNFTNAPALTGIEELVFGALPPSEISEAVTVALAPVFRVTLKV